VLQYQPACVFSPYYTKNECDGPTSEDCLYLNVYRPSQAGDAGAKPLPVLLWVYGGGFLGGSATTYNASSLCSQSAEQQMVVVVASYRVGLLSSLALQELYDENPDGGYGNLAVRATLHG